MILLKSNSRFSLPLPAREPLHYRWSTASPEDSKDNLRCCAHRLCKFPTTVILLWITTYTCPFNPIDLVITRYLGNSLYYSENTLYLLPCSSLSTYTPLRIISHTYRVSAHPELFMCFTKFFKIIFDLPKILSSLLLLKFLLACIMVNPISIVILLASLVTIILESIDSVSCECSQSSVES